MTSESSQIFNHGKAFPVLRLKRTQIEGHTCLKRAKQRKVANFVEVTQLSKLTMWV